MCARSDNITSEKNQTTTGRASLQNFNRILIIFLVFSYLFLNNVGAQIEATNLVILQYHHVAKDTPQSTSVTPAEFAQHMAHLAENHKVIALESAIQAIKIKKALPENSVAITFDDGFTNILLNAHPILEQYGFPYTVFINPAIIGESPSQLTWEEIKQMQPLATFANHTLDHAHLLDKYGNESKRDTVNRAMKDIKQAELLMQEKLGYSKKWLAFPFGEFNNDLKSALLANGYIGFGQQSGAVNFYSDFGALPRFPAAGYYAKLDSLKVKLNSLAMPIVSYQPNRVEYKPGEEIKELVLQIDEKDVRLNAFACYFNGEKLKFTGIENEVRVQVNHITEPGRARINCTAPSSRHPSRYYWYSYPIFTANHDGTFID